MPRYFYKYVPEARIDILQNHRVCFSRPSALNDPFEMKPFFADVAQTDDAIADHQGRNRERILREVYPDLVTKLGTRGLKTWPTVESFLTDAKNNPDVVDEVIARITTGVLDEKRADMQATRAERFAIIDDITGLLCLAQSPVNLLMWAHYANSHKGFVIEFNGDHKWFRDAANLPVGFGHFGPVHYGINRPNSQYMSEQSYADTFLNKSMEWKYEQEWRMIRRLDEAVHPLPIGGLFDLPPDAITAIIFGCQIAPDDRNAALSTLKTDTSLAHVAVKQARIDEQLYKLHIEAI